MSFTSETKNVFVDACKTSFTLFKIIIPVSIIVKILSELGLIDVIGESLSPVMGLVGLPGDFGIVWATTMITNIYGGMIAFFNLSLSNILFCCTSNSPCNYDAYRSYPTCRGTYSSKSRGSCMVYNFTSSWLRIYNWYYPKFYFYKI